METARDNELKVDDLLGRYANTETIRSIEGLTQKLGARVHIKGCDGSLAAVLAATCFNRKPSHAVFVLKDREEALYFQSDLKNLLPGMDVLLFPSSHRKPYELLEIENANILQRAEVLNQISNANERKVLIVTFPDALTERVINQRSLVEHTLSAKVGEKVDVNFMTELLTEYHFEKTDFVFEAGQYAIRGGIIDVFSYANDMPYRIELFGDEIDSIRTFDSLTQLSSEPKEYISIIPDVQTKFMQESRESFLEYIPSETTMWLRDPDYTLEVVQNYFKKATEEFSEILVKCGYTKVINEPEELFEPRARFQSQLEKFTLIGFGSPSSLGGEAILMNVEPQPSFKKNFNLMSERIGEHAAKGMETIIASDSLKQFQRLATIFDEINPQLEYSEFRHSLSKGFEDIDNQIAIYTDHQLFERFHRYQAKDRYSKSKALTLKELKALQIGDFVTHIDYGIARFGGLEKSKNNPNQEAIRLIFQNDDLVYVSVHALHKISKYSGKEGVTPQISKLGSPEWEKKKSKVKKKVKDIAKDLIELYAKRKQSKGFAFSPDNYLQAELESSFIYEDTPDQSKATQDAKDDMEQPYPMDRLVCGDVGFGKTEVAIRAAFKAVCDSKQVAVMVPTTILAMQHYKTFSKRMAELPCRVDFVNRFRTTKQIKETLKDVQEGKVDILIGTHRIVSKDVNFKDLGLMVIDEEQKFGVKTKEKLKEMKVNVDVLTLTATPIPRTLQFSLMGSRDLSIISTPPPNRQPVTTRLYNYSDEVIRDAIRHELHRGGQVFVVHNRVNDIESVANNIISLLPDAKVAYAHGQMDGARLEKIMMRFIDGEYDVLVSTNIIESGLDIPNANTIIINHAHLFGLADLHQMRGRVGRSNIKAYCYMFVPSLTTIPAETRKRLSVLEEFSDLGDGIKVAMKDLDIRGAGDLLGGEQSGFISDIGFDMYNKILEEAVMELKETEFKGLFEKEIDMHALKVDCNVETDFDVAIPESYVNNISERLNLYITADEINTEEELEAFRNDLRDRFGPIPEQTEDLFKTVRLRWLGKKMGVEKLVVKGGNMKAYLLPSTNEKYYQSDTFGKILAFATQNPSFSRIKEAKNRVIFALSGADSVERCYAYFKQVMGE